MGCGWGGVWNAVGAVRIGYMLLGWVVLLNGCFRFASLGKAMVVSLGVP